jgi:RNA polymerase sigma-70 factor (ECF subfamily)
MLFEKRKSGREAFSQAALEHLDALYGTALRLTAQVAEAEDLVHDTYLRALRFSHRFEPGTNLKAWMFKMMFNLFVNRYHRIRRSREIQEGAERHDLMEKMLPEEHLAPSTRPEEYFFERMFSDDVVKAIEQLPHDFKMVVLLSDVNGFSYAQIAEILDIPVGTVMSRLHRGRRLLRVALHDFAKQEGYIQSGTADADAPNLTSLDEFRARRHGEG